jgi:NTP pyrophosphatase (non-canonical NTP hydrolase)
MRKLQRHQGRADDSWGFDFYLWDSVAGLQMGLPGVAEDMRNPQVDATIRRLEYIALALGGEVGELGNEVKKIRRQLLQGQNFVDLDLSNIKEEIADVLAYLLKLCNLMSWDLEKLYLEKMKTNEERFGEIGKKGSAGNFRGGHKRQR